MPKAKKMPSTYKGRQVGALNKFGRFTDGATDGNNGYGVKIEPKGYRFVNGVQKFKKHS